MKLYRKQAVRIGILFLAAMASYMVGSELTASSVNSANQFTNINMNFCRLVLSSNLSTLPPYWESLYFFIEYSKHIARQLPFFMCCHDPWRHFYY